MNEGVELCLIIAINICYMGISVTEFCSALEKKIKAAEKK